MNSLAAASLDEPVRADAEASRWHEYRGEFSEVFTERAVRQVEAGAALPIEPDCWLTDRWAVESVENLSDELDDARAEEKRLGQEHEDLLRERARVKRPMFGLLRWALHLLTAALAVTVGVVLGLLMASSIDAYVLRNWITEIVSGNGSVRYSAAMGAVLACLVSLAFTLTQAVVFLAGEHIRLHVKVYIVLIEIVFTAAFGATRIGEEFSFQAIAVTGLEIAILLIYALALSVIGRRLVRDRDERDAYQPLKREERAMGKVLRDHRKQVMKLEAQLATERAALEERETEARRAPAYAELARVTAETAYRVTVSNMMAAALDDPADDARAARADGHLREVEARPLSPSHEVFKW